MWSSDEVATVRRSFPKGIVPLGYVQNASSPDTKALLRFINPKTAIHTFSLTTPTGSEWRNEGNTCWVPATAGKGTVAVHRFLQKKDGRTLYALATQRAQMLNAGHIDKGIVFYLFTSPSAD